MWVTPLRLIAPNLLPAQQLPWGQGGFGSCQQGPAPGPESMGWVPRVGGEETEALGSLKLKIARKRKKKGKPK